MNKKSIFVAAVAVGAISVACMAQVEEEEQDGPIAYSYATYSYCKLSSQSDADEIVKETEAPVYNELIEEGVISDWGWLSHHTGGKWRRIFYYSAPTVNDLLDAADAMAAKFDALDQDNDRSDICYAHDDYIWAVDLAGGDRDAPRADAGMSVYYICNESTEDRADEIFESTFAPLMDTALEEGKIASWSWLSHFVGGKYRRLHSITGADHKTLLAARGDVIEALYGDEPNAEAIEFNKICNGHTDYLWDTVITSP